MAAYGRLFCFTVVFSSEHSGSKMFVPHFWSCEYICNRFGLDANIRVYGSDPGGENTSIAGSRLKRNHMLLFGTVTEGLALGL